MKRGWRPGRVPPIARHASDDTWAEPVSRASRDVLAAYGNIEAQANWPGEKMHGAQRQALAIHIGRSQGNQHVQRLVQAWTSSSHARMPAVGPRATWSSALSVQRQPKGNIPPTARSSTPSTAQGVTKIFVFDVQDQGYIQEMIDYITNTLGQGAILQRVTGIEQMFTQLLKLAPTKGRLARSQRVSRLIIVGHGGRRNKLAGAVKMVPPTPANKRPPLSPQEEWVSPAKVLNYAQTSAMARRVRKEVMAPGAVAEFWGCNIGAYSTARKAWSKATGAEFRATAETFETGTCRFGYAPQTPHEIVNSESIPGVGVQYIPQRTAEVYSKKDASLSKKFNAWLLRTYRKLASSGEIAETRPKPRNTTARLAYMRQLFDRSKGVIRYVRIRVRRPRKGQPRLVRPTPTQMRHWLKLWKRTPFNP